MPHHHGQTDVGEQDHEPGQKSQAIDPLISTTPTLPDLVLQGMLSALKGFTTPKYGR
jgi:hypothetical protein